MSVLLAELPNPELMNSKTAEGSQSIWQVFVDRSTRYGGSGVGIFLVSPFGEETQIAIWLRFKVSNNEVEYEIVLSWLQPTRVARATWVQVHSDLQLVASHIQGSFIVKDECMTKYVKAYEQMKAQFQEVRIQQILRKENRRANELTWLASSFID